MCTSAQTGTWRRVRIGTRLIAATNHMLLIVGVAIVLIAVRIIPRMWVTVGVNPPLGWMSEQWLTEHRASHPL